MSTLAPNLQSLLGLIVIPLLALALRERGGGFDPRATARLIGVGLALQIAIALLMLGVPATQAVFRVVGDGVSALQDATAEGMRLVFGYLAGAPAPFEVVRPEHAFVAAFEAFPLILLVSALTSLLFFWGVLQKLVHGVAALLTRSMGVSGPLGTAAAANIFVGMIEAPLFIRPYLRTMDRGALFAVMTVGLATIAGTVLVLYSSVLTPVLPGAAGHLIVASVISAPAALMLAQLMVPAATSRTGGVEGDGGDDAGPGDNDADNQADNRADVRGEAGTPGPQPSGSIDAIAMGTANGVTLLGGVISTLIVFVALVALSDQILAAISAPFGITLTLERIGGWLFAPLAWLIGVPWDEAGRAGALLGIKTVTNELVAIFDLAEGSPLSERTTLILTYALSGFANFGSVGIMIGGLSAIVPERRAEIVNLGLKSLVAGTLATLMTGAVIGLVGFG